MSCDPQGGGTAAAERAMVGVVLSRAQRDALREEVIAALTGLDDVLIAIRHEEFAHARMLRQRCEALFRLLDDLGWGERDDGERFVLTLAPEVLTLAVSYLHDLATAGVHHQLGVQLEAQEVSARELMVLASCGAILAQLAQPHQDGGPLR